MTIRNLQVIVLAEVLLLLCGLAPVHSLERPWNVLIFVQHLPHSVCEKWKALRWGNSCGHYPRNHWTIHGIWPTLAGTRGPNDCDPGNQFSLEDVGSLERELEEWWTPIEDHGRKTSFWEHEWSKHGTCAVPIIPNQYQYFKQALDWAKEYNMRDILEQGGIRQGRKYTIEEITDGVKSVVKRKPQVTCYLNQKRESVLLEVRLCFDKSLQLTDCNDYTNCHGSTVEYPS